jgi:hypothetical protein
MNEPEQEAITEPDNSTVNDWHGQEVQRDADARQQRRILVWEFAPVLLNDMWRLTIPLASGG